jgi:hypothetical protein
MNALKPNHKALLRHYLSHNGELMAVVSECCHTQPQPSTLALVLLTNHYTIFYLIYIYPTVLAPV